MVQERGLDALDGNECSCRDGADGSPGRRPDGETFSCPTVRSPAVRWEQGKECSDLLSRGKELQRGMHDVRRAIPASWSRWC